MTLQVKLYRRRPPAGRLDATPFGILYVVLAAAYFSTASADGGGLPALLCCGGVLLAHLALLLSAAWSVPVRCWLGYVRVRSLVQAEVVLATPPRAQGAPEICELLRAGSQGGRGPPVEQQSVELTCSGGGGGGGGATQVLPLPDAWFVFQMTKYCHVRGEEFVPLQYPSELTGAFLAGYRGYVKADSHGAAVKKWGKNIFDIPLPAFEVLLQEHCVAPFFVFQVFCVGLWCLDDYWYYSIFTLVMLLVFEATQVKVRIRNLEQLRKMRRPPQEMCVFRNQKWLKISSEDLVPGDICSLKQDRKKPNQGGGDTSSDGGGGGGGGGGAEGEDRLCPCDVLILRGSVVANEAMLTGESVPKRKEGVASVGDWDDEIRRLRQHGVQQQGEQKKGEQKKGEDGPQASSEILDRHTVFGGTKIILHIQQKQQQQ